MKKLIAILGVPLVAIALAVPALAADPPPPPTTTAAPEPNPFPGKKHDVFLYVDTVQNSRPKGGVIPAVGCTHADSFKRGQAVVFRMWGVEVATGDALTMDNVKYAYVKIPGQPNLKFSFGAHGKGATAPWFWTANWEIAADYPLGTVNFKVVVKTKSGKFGSFSQNGLAATSALNIIP